MNMPETVELAEHVARAIFAKAADGDAAWTDIEEDERNDARTLAHAAIEAHDAWLIAQGWRLVPPGTFPAPVCREEAVAMGTVARTYLEAQSRKKTLLVPSSGLVRPC